MARSYRAGIIGWTGHGNYGHGLDTVWTGLEGVEVVAVADPDESGREAARARSGATRGYADFREMLRREDLDLVSVGPRWPDCHDEMVVAAAEAGARGIFCEKPFSRTLTEADHMIAVAERTGAKIAVAFQHRAMKVCQEMRRIATSGEIGEIREIRGRPTIGPRGGAQLFVVLGPHILDLMRYVAGNPAWVSGRVTTRDGREATVADARELDETLGPYAGDAVSATYGFSNGVTGFCDSYFAPAVLPGTMSLEIWGTEGVIAMRDGPRLRRLYRSSATSKNPIGDLEPVMVPGWDDDPRTEMKPGMSLGFLNEYLARDLIAAIEENRAPIASGNDARWTLEMIVGTHAAHLAGARLPLPARQRENPYQARTSP